MFVCFICVAISLFLFFFFFFSSRRRHTRFDCDWSSDVCSSDLTGTCLECVMDIDCGASDACQTRTCVNSTCMQSFTPPGMAAGMQTSADCKIGRASCRERV